MSQCNPLQIEVERLEFTYEEDKSPIFQNLSFSIKDNDCILVLGPSGSGKSTLAFCLNKLYPEAVDGIVKGNIIFQGKKLEDYQSGELNQKIGVVFQDPESQFCMVTVEEELAFGLENMNIPRHEMEAKINEALGWVGLTSYKKEAIHSLSGGQKQKLALACVLALQPEVLILDEPTANLDPLSSKELVETVNRLKKRLAFTLIVIEHKLDDWLELIDRCLVLDSDGKLLFDGTPSICFNEYAQFLQKEGIWLPKAVETGILAKASGIYKGDSLPLNLKELMNGLTETVCFFKKEAQSVVKSILKVNRLCFSRNRQPILNEISFSINAGELVAIVGANGSGKTTLSKCITGLLPPSHGDIQFNDVALREWKEQELWKKIGYVFQNPEHQFVTNTVFDEIAFGLRVNHKSEEEVKKMVSSILEKTRLVNLVDAHPFTLSQGQKRRLSVATMLVNLQDLLILDEPTFGQDAITAKEIMNLLEEKTQQLGAVLMISHDMDLVDQYADRVFVVEKGEIIFEGTPEVLWNNKELLFSSRLKLPFRKQLEIETAKVSGGGAYAAT